jgi:hypothetical protein
MPDFGIFRGFNSKLFSDKLYAGQLPTQLGLIGSTDFSPYLLDLYPNAAAAYSLRLLRKNYTGNAIRVRRSSDNTEQNIGFTISGELDTSSLTSFCGSGNGFVTTWYDQSEIGRNATQTTAGNQPQIVSSGIVITENGKPTVFNSSNSSCLNLSSSITTVNFTILWVSKKSTNVAADSIILTGGQNGQQYMGDDVNNEGNPTAYTGSAIIRTALNNSSSSGGETSRHLAYLNRRNSTQAVGQYNNSNNSYNNSVSSTNAVISSIANYSSGYNFVGNLQEIIIYSTDESSNRIGISNNINNYYGIY